MMMMMNSERGLKNRKAGSEVSKELRSVQCLCSILFARKMYFKVVFIFCFCFLDLMESKKYSDVTLATYNIWNVMFHWEIRKLYIAEMIEKHGIDVIAFQEVRAHKDKSRNQLNDLQDLLPAHQWLIYHPTHLVKRNSEKGPPGWEWEGIGLLSKHRILSYHEVNLNKGDSIDENPRALISAQIEVNDKEISVVALHLSYDRKAQCDNAWDVLKYLHSAGVEQTVLLGDLNVYDNYQWPVDALMNGNFAGDAPDKCKRKIKPWFHGHSDYKFVDAWSTIYPNRPGFTFSNMPNPGLHNRPDRILVSKTGLKVQSVFIAGYGDEYATLYKNKLYWTRLNSIQQVANKLTNGIIYDQACHWDCGPNGICRCGICVIPKETSKICGETYCEACGPARLKLYEFLLVSLIAAITFLIISIMTVILKVIVGRRKVCLRICKTLKLSVLGKMYFIVIVLVVIIGLYGWFTMAFQDVFKLAESQIAEELFPSDHLMVVTELTVS